MDFSQENEDGTFNRRVPVGNVEWDDTHLCPASALTPAERAMFRVVDFREVPPPAPGRWQAVREAGPIKVDGAWHQQWEVYDLPLTLAEKVTDIKRQADDIARQKRDQVVAGISPAEMASWPIKRAEAIAYSVSGAEADAPALAIESRVRGVPLLVLADKVLAKAGQLAALEAAIAGRCGAIQDAATAAQSEDELLAIDLEAGWPV